VSTINDPEIRAFLAQGTRTGKLAYLSSSGRPLVTPIWFIVEADSLVFNTGATTAKGR
jgi:nitroimidazol reductase NimA-like FMN-containing flavoprotein (pyridoxamine 5'-phosphate oxidase superfamily)